LRHVGLIFGAGALAKRRHQREGGMDEGSVADDRAIFAARLSPRRSLTPAGARRVMAASFIASALFSLPFYLIGAWPIIGFLGLDVALLWLAFRASFRAARAYEDYRLTYLELQFAKVSAAGGRSEWRFNPSWVTLERGESATVGHPLALRSGGARLEIAKFLGPAEKQAFAGELIQALGEARRGRRFPQ
jgi:uncharacterized membrane protein